MANIKITPKRIRAYSLLIGVVSFLILSVCGQIVSMNTKKEGKLRAAFTAETTVNQIQSHISKYLTVSELFKNMIESGYELDNKEFTKLSELISDDSGIIKAIELAPDGIVSEIYPLKGNEAAFGIDMLNNPARKYEANLAKESGEYTIAGPYELNQGGMGALLFEPIYVSDISGVRSFWGFSILVIDWEKFTEELNLDKLDDANICYQIWKKDGNSQSKNIIAEGGSQEHGDTLQVSCKVPNDTWYFEIVPHEGWITTGQKISGILVSFGISLLSSIIAYQAFHKKYRERVYTAEIQKSAEEAKEANEAKTRFLFNMSHDIRTPMNAIVGFAGLLEKNIHDEKKAVDYIKKIQISGDILLTLINQILEMARIESGKVTLSPETVDIREMMKAMHTIFEDSLSRKSLEYECSLNLRHNYIVCDKTKVEEIMLNIVGNSIKYTNPHGKIRVTVDEQESENRNRANYFVVIEDTGIGMSKDYLPHIFEEFSREHTSTETRVEGTGLGLPIVKSLIQLMGGTIEVESKVGVGSRFMIRIPFRIAEETTEMQKEEESLSSVSGKLKGKSILLAEDNDLNAEIAETILEELGVKVRRVEDGIQCIAELQNRPEKYFDVILMDIQMPHMDGYTAAKVIRSLNDPRSGIPIIAMTANAFNEDRREARKAGMNGFLAKPLNVDEMIRLLGKITKV